MTQKRTFDGPVRWLLGAQLLAGLKYIALYTGFKTKLDHRDWMHAECISFEGYEGDAFWFDYAADTGDDRTAAYSLAYLWLSDLNIDGINLPRGEFLFVGGDTAYHIADYSTLAYRFRTPICWAYKDLIAHGGSVPKRPVFGIPGNHDYYDALDGFNRQFAKPHTPDGEPDRQRMPPQLSLSGFTRQQTASYLALNLPFGWRLWGIDCESGKVDVRQQQFFKELFEHGAPPKKLIVCTSVPTTVFGRKAELTDPTPKALKDLDLPPVFIDPESLQAGECRLDLAGDVHHYARFCTSSKGDYASVVAGGGGAFLHPSDTRVGPLPCDAVYPSPEVSRAETAKKLFTLSNIIGGGYVALIAGLVSVACYFAATVPVTTRSISNWWLQHVFKLETGPYRFASVLPAVPTAPDGSMYSSSWSVLITPLVLFLLLAAWVIFSRKGFHPPRDPDLSKTQVSYRNWPGAALLGSFLFIALLAIHAPTSDIFAENMLLLIAVFSAVLTTVESAMFGDFVARYARTTVVSKSHRLFPQWVLMLLTFLLITIPVIRFGNGPVIYTISDFLAAVLALTLLVGLPLLAAIAGAYLKPLKGKLLMMPLGLWFGFLLLFTPLVLLRANNVWFLLLTLVASFIFGRIGASLMSRFRAGLLLASWGLFGFLVLFGAAQAPKWLPPFPIRDSGWVHFPLVFLAGLFMGCVWFSWYLAVSCAFNGHNNEAGGAARIGDYKHFIRFRLTKDGLTGYVIAIDKPQTDGQSLKPKIVDQFTINPKAGI